MRTKKNRSCRLDEVGNIESKHKHKSKKKAYSKNLDVFINKPFGPSKSGICYDLCSCSVKL